MSPFLLQCCCSHVALQSHVNIAEGKGHTYIGVSRIFGEDCRFVIFCSKDSQVQKSWTCICQKACEAPFRLLISKIYCQIYQKEHTLSLSCIKLLISIPFNSQTLTFSPKKVPTLFHPPSSERFHFSFQPQKREFFATFLTNTPNIKA